jgi:hypothetical protein
MPEAVGSSILQGWGNVVVVLVCAHLVALAYWVFKVATESSPSKKSAEDKE